MLKCDLVTFESAGREITLLPAVDSVTAALQIGISAASCSSGRIICDGVCQFKTCPLEQGVSFSNSLKLKEQARLSLLPPCVSDGMLEIVVICVGLWILVCPNILGFLFPTGLQVLAWAVFGVCCLTEILL